ncbi:winged helix-turn-helix transcriptional regulator [Pseudonocardia spinosispora]|uniref:winged helix-turn-helix transcriptional regulator n=1 Tax=Pseudonocardia spinosispora TaxID=103441 RepID=UPI0004139C61|nr:helix-turn-helix domain-containing protein [Pseudonocardia spinosispora]
MIGVLGRTYDGEVCSLARALEIVGERWTLLIVRDALLGLRRFEEFSESLGAARNILTDRLGRLVSAGVLERVRYQERPDRYEYRLTAMGHGLAVPVLSLMQWGDAHLAGPAGPPRLALHASCGGPLAVSVTCSDCESRAEVEDVRITWGPGFGG